MWREGVAPRTVWLQPDLDNPDAPSNQGGPFKDGAYVGFERPDRQLVGTEDDYTATARGNLVSSLTNRGTHRPVIDIDGGCEVRPSKTPGHFHLYIDKEMTFDDYSQLLYYLVRAGIVEPNYYSAVRDAEQSYVRLRPEDRPARDAQPTNGLAVPSRGYHW
jgi:hypothetical protein